MHERHQQYLAHLSQRADEAVARHGLQGVRAEVVLVLDVSKSMYQLYKANLVAELATRLLALSLEFDDDGTIPAYAFGDTCRHLGDLTVGDFAGWVEREVIRTGSDFQNGCMYAPAIHEVCSYFFPEDWHRPTTQVKVGRIFKRKATVYPTLSGPRVHPVYALFVTSGDCQDQVAAADAVRRSSRLPIFWQFIGLQPAKGPQVKFKFLEKLDNLGNTHVDNAGFFEVSDTRNDGVLFEGMCKEFPSYLALPEVRAMLAPAQAGGRQTKGTRGEATQQGQDTAARMPAFEPDDEVPVNQVDALMREKRAAAAARAQSKRSERSRVDVAASPDVVEATSTLAPQASRTLKAANATRTAQPLRADRSAGQGDDGPRKAATTEAPSGSEARRERRQRLHTQQQQQSLPDRIEELQAQLVRQIEPTLIRPASDGGTTADEPFETDEAPAATDPQDERTQLVSAQPDDGARGHDAGGALSRLEAIRARRAARKEH